MNWTLIFFSVLAGASIAIFFYVRSTMKKSVTFLSEKEFGNAMRKGQLIDIRKKDDFNEGHINGSRNIPIGALNKSFSKLRTDQTIYLVCSEGKAAKRAAVLLSSKGFSNICALDGGIKNWTKQLKTKK
ncbi:MAG: rhodanese-like domain-containing protein [Turicibacter sp.]|nr:rhodanese-like domain-containing protein [Turicibacter sp.]